MEGMLLIAQPPTLNYSRAISLQPPPGTPTKVGEAAKIHLVLLQIGVRWSAIQISGLCLGLPLTSSPPILLESDLGDAAYLGNIDAEPSGLLRLLVFWF